MTGLLPWAAGTLALVLGLGFLTAGQASSARNAVERAQARRLAEQVARSAFEEASARVEAALPALPPPDPEDRRDPARTLTWPDGSTLAAPGRVEPAAARADAGTACEVGAVEIEASDWDSAVMAGPGGTLLALEVAVLTMRVTVTTRVAGRRTARRFGVRRFLELRPSGSAECRGRIPAGDAVVLEEEEL